MFRVVLFITLTGLMAAGAGCQSYAPDPIDSEAHRALWEARYANEQDVRSLIDSVSEHSGRPAAFDLEDGISLAEARLLALLFNPRLRAEAARVGVQAASAAHAGLWEDPSLSIDVMRVLGNVSEPWIIGGMVGLTIPVSGRLGAEQALADAQHDAALAELRSKQWNTQANVSQLWMEYSAATLKIELLRDLLQREARIVEAAEQMEAAGTLRRLEGRLFRMERATRRNELVLQEGRQKQLELQLRNAIGLTPEAPFDFIATLAPDQAAEATDPIAAIDAGNMELASLRIAYQAAERSLAAEIRKQYPDIEIGPGYERDRGEDKVGLGAGFMLPLWNANRRGIAVARAEREAARLEFESTFEQLVSEYEQTRVRHESSVASRQLIESELVPLAEAQIDDERRMAELGELDVLLTLESVVRAHDTRIGLIDARLAESLAVIRMRELLGPEPVHVTSEEDVQP